MREEFDTVIMGIMICQLSPEIFVTISLDSSYQIFNAYKCDFCMNGKNGCLKCFQTPWWDGVLRNRAAAGPVRTELVAETT